jgi:hypothetical protein
VIGPQSLLLQNELKVLMKKTLHRIQSFALVENLAFPLVKIQVSFPLVDAGYIR